LGLGIIGVEGDAAAKAADFSFAKFRYLQRALFVHGQWYYNRLSTLVQYSFYKNVASFTCNLLFAIYSNWSGISMYDDLYLVMFNMVYTSLPIIVFGLCEQNVEAKKLLGDPNLYRRNRHNQSMRFGELCKWVGLGLWHSLVCFYGTYFVWSSFGQFGDDIRAFGTVVGFNVVLVVNLKLLLISRHWSALHVSIIALSISSYFLIVLLLQQWLRPRNGNSATFRTFAHALGAFPTWGMMLPVVATALLPDYLLRVAEDNRHKFEKMPAEATRLLQRFKKGKSKGDSTCTNDQEC